ncbi:MAG: hydantoinase B/oxoprolinase family protein [Phycisphaerales bacterium]|nr:hydantoinase B/oxoprolinase family protein [Phycisphaerales bacterium]
MNSEQALPSWHFWIDRGGTFTDIVAWKEGSGELLTSKVRSEDPGRREDASLAAIRAVLGLEDTADLRSLGAVSIRMGTTVATNALLTRSGARTVVVLTKGLGDLLVLGDQARPHLFELNIRRPRSIWDRVIEADERIDVHGKVIRPLDEAKLRSDLATAREAGLETCAVALVHGWIHHTHEQRIVALAREAGFEEIVASHIVCPLQGLLGRAQTTVVDASLTPSLQRSITALGKALPEAHLEFMQSSGGLTQSPNFRGARAVLSGPAGGIVGAAEVAKEHDQIITFDMGGTSTDVAWYDGTLHRTWEARVDGVQLRVPMLEIDTIAAGGGSICRFDGQRLRVGPESSGAQPGPACYRSRGPATVTDCHVVLGRLDAELLPSVFGPARDQSIDAAASHDAFEKIAEQVRESGHQELSVEELAEGCLRIAVERMAGAVRRISIEQGRSLEDVTLVSFGGAGGQAACLVAEALGIRRVLVHPHAGVLSALGIGLATPSLSSECTLSCELESTEVKQVLDGLEAGLREQFAVQGIEPEAMTVQRRIHVKVMGWDGSIPVEEADAATMRQAFLDQAHRRYGLDLDDETIVVEMVEVEIGSTSQLKIPPQELKHGSLPEPSRSVKARFNGQIVQTGIWSRASIPQGTSLEGPAIIAEAGATTIVEPGWSLSCLTDGSFILEHVQQQASIEEDCLDRVDPILLEVFGHRFMAIADEMGAMLRRTAHSVNIKERLDFSCAIFDRSGRLVANGPHMPVHLGSMDHSVQSVLAAHGDDLKPGDAWLLNDPYHGGTHLPDLTVVTPMYAEGDQSLQFLVASRGHHADIGGLTPGSMPATSRVLEEEGVIIKPARIVRDGKLDEDFVRKCLGSGRWPARKPDQNIADLRAQLAANARGVEELHRLVNEFGQQTVQAYMGHVMDNGEACVRSLLPRFQKRSFQVAMDNGSTVHLEVRPEDSKVTFDFSGTTQQCDTNFNAPPAVTRAAVLYSLRCLINDDIPLNEGCLRPVEIIIPEGTLLNPLPPAAVVAGNVETSQCVVDAILAALQAQAASQGTMNNLTFGNERYQYYETLCGGTGAGPGFDGTDAVHSHMTNSRLTDPEILESRYPVRLERFSIRDGSGGTGRYKGGSGAIREIAFLEPMTVNLLSGRRTQHPFGLEGGGHAAGGTQCVLRANGEVEELGATASVEVSNGDRFLLQTPGGGGFGSSD